MITDWAALQLHDLWDTVGRFLVALAAVTLAGFGVRWVLKTRKAP